MSDMVFEAGCPCGDNVKVSGYSSDVKAQILSWRSIHTRHANRIAKAVETNTMYPMRYIMPETITTTEEETNKQEDK